MLETLVLPDRPLVIDAPFRGCPAEIHRIPLPEGMKESGYSLTKYEFPTKELISSYRKGTLVGESCEELRQRKPRLEDKIWVGVTEFPPGTTLDFDERQFGQDRAFGAVYKQERSPEGTDILGLVSGGVTGNRIAEVAGDFAKAQRPFPSRSDEYLSYVATALQGKSGVPATIAHAQFGGLFYNDGSASMKRNAEGDLIAVSQDVELNRYYSRSAFFGRRAPFSGYAVDEKGGITFQDLALDVTSQEALEASFRASGHDRFIGTPVVLVRDGKALETRELLNQKWNGDARHAYDLPFTRIVGPDGKNVGGSVLLEVLQDMMRSGNSDKITEALLSVSRLPIPIDNYPVSKGLIESALKTPEGRKELVRGGVSVKMSPSGAMEVSYVPKLNVYNHLICGIKDGKFAVAIISGLLEGKISGQSGVPVDVLARLAEDLGFDYATFGSQGKDGYQLFMNGLWFAPVFDQSMLKYYETISGKVATSNSVMIVSKNKNTYRG